MKLWPAFAVLLVSGAACAADGPSQTTLYKSVGPDGRTVYGDRPPADGRSAQTLKFQHPPSSPPSAATLAFLEELKMGAGLPQAAPSGELVLFTASWCGYCKQARAYLGAKGASYREVDIESKIGAASFAQAGGQRGVPLLVRNGQRVQGFSAAAYEALLSARR